MTTNVRRRALLTAAAGLLLAACGAARRTVQESPPASTGLPAPFPPTPPSLPATATATSTPVLTPATTTAPPVSPTPLLPPGLTDWLRARAFPFRTAAPDDDFRDLQPLKSLVGTARIVALGEATHGTREFFQMKDRVVRFLVTEMGFTLFGIEATMPEAFLVNDYVQNGVGDPAALLAGLRFWTWNTREVLDLILWMRAYNAGRGEKPAVGFFGFDIEYPQMAMDYVVSYLEQNDATAAITATARYAFFRMFQSSMLQYADKSSEEKERCRADVQAVYDDLRGRRAEYAAKSGSRRFSLALQHARLVVQGEAFYGTSLIRNYSEAGTKRDAYMAENAAWLLDGAEPSAKIVLWAHNDHVGLTPYGTVKSMGLYLHERYSDAQRVLGFSFYAGRFNALGVENAGRSYTALTSHSATLPLPDSYEAAFHALNEPRLILDLRVRGDAVFADWMRGPRPFRGIGSVYNEARGVAYFAATRLPEKFDAVIHFEDTSPSTLLPMTRS